MSAQFEFREIEGKVSGFFQRTIAFIRSFFKSLLAATEGYIRSKTKHMPKNLPLGRRASVEAILEHEHHQRFLQGFARESGIAVDHVEETFRRYLHEIAADLNYLTMPFWDFFLTLTFDTIYEGLEIDKASLEKIQPLIDQRPVIFVSNHRSHMDYLLLSYVFYHQRMPVPHICAGSNLSFWPLGALFRKSGAFFIRRSYEGNKLYVAAVQAYIEELIRNKTNLEFFIEGTRSRTGKLLPPRFGILSAIMQSYLNGASDDILFVPTALTYESVLEEKGYLEERSGASKKDEGFWDLLRLRKFLKKKKGKVYVQFGEPVSMKGFLEKSGSSVRFQKKDKVRQLAYELTYGINKSMVVTPSSLVATALLTNRGRSIAIDPLEERVDFYLDYLRFKKCRLSERLQKDRENAIADSLHHYERGGLIESFDDQESLLYRVREDRHPLLDYYKNTSLHFFVSMGVLAAILLIRSEPAISLQEVEEDYVFLQDLFQYEFTFSRRQTLGTHIERLLEYLVKREWIRRDGETIDLLPGGRESLGLLSSPLRSFFEGYYVLWRSLSLLGKRRVESKELLSFLQERGNVLYLKEEIRHFESINKFTFQNALYIFRDLGILNEEKEGWGKKKRDYYSVKGPGENIGRKLGELLGKT